jgi:hypothetical protein
VHQFFQSPQPLLPLINGLDLPEPQPVGQFLGIRTVGVIVSGHFLVLPGITDHDLGHSRPQQIVKPGRLRPLFKDHVDGPARARSMNSRIVPP